MAGEEIPKQGRGVHCRCAIKWQGIQNIDVDSTMLCFIVLLDRAKIVLHWQSNVVGMLGKVSDCRPLGAQIGQDDGVVSI